MDLRDGRGKFDGGDGCRCAVVAISGGRRHGRWRGWFVRGPGRSSGGLAAEGVRYAFGVADFLRGSGHRDQSLEDGVDEEPAHFTGARERDSLFFSQRPFAFEAGILADEATFHDLDVIAVGSPTKGSELGHAVFHFRLLVAEELGKGLSFLSGWECGDCWELGKRIR